MPLKLLVAAATGALDEAEDNIPTDLIEQSPRARPNSSKIPTTFAMIPLRLSSPEQTRSALRATSFPIGEPAFAPHPLRAY